MAGTNRHQTSAVATPLPQEQITPSGVAPSSAPVPIQTPLESGWMSYALPLGCAATTEQMSFPGPVGLGHELGVQVDPAAPGVPVVQAEASLKRHEPPLKQQATGCGQVLGEQVEPMEPGVPEQSDGVATVHVPLLVQHAAVHRPVVPQAVPEPRNEPDAGHRDWHMTAQESR